ncbi:lipase secretion chaperone [Chondromyces apiculatus]|uniref:Lipase helper protein n=1 Tax=Chondromyces apiculatus DSM 436 TaxID=1192034 RepID=A0A017SU24_9BACT|nr:lipase secretion chaperone [Chondromyces apiculatus]EYF00075.1 Hypothetical protein CAP_1397 [Chondromyces apiculatus DSM 436]
MKTRWQGATLGGVAVAGALALWLRGSDGAPPPSPGPRRPEAAATAGRPEAPRARPVSSTAAAPAAPSPGEAAAANLPRSLQGTEIDDALRVDDRGRLVLGPEVIRFFNYFLSATGEETDATLRARVLAAIHERLEDPAASQAEKLFEKYLAMREASRSLSGDLEKEAEPSARLESIRRLRREHFSEDEAEALFGAEEQESAVAAAQSEVMRDGSLSEQERQAKLDALANQLPEQAREARAASRLPAEQFAEEEAMRAAGATAAELHQHRLATVGPEAAERLRTLDQQRSDWEQRLDAFRAARAKVADATADPDARQVAVLSLLERSFSPPEQLRARAILKMRGEPIEM